jgi:hypothetical protein
VFSLVECDVLLFDWLSGPLESRSVYAVISYHRLQGSVLLDTANLDAAQQRATAADVHVAAAVAAAAGGAGAAAGEVKTLAPSSMRSSVC